MAAVNLNFTLNKEHATYAPGEEILGSLNIEVAHRIKATLISVHIFGVGSIRYIPKDGEGDQACYKRETYVEEEKMLYNAKDQELPDLFREAECRSFNFTFMLPQNIPSSLESEEVYVRYMITGKLEGFDLPDYDTKTYITVNSVVDLNDIYISRQPATSVLNRNNSCWSCSSNTGLQAAVHTPRRGYVPGEIITINAEVNNMDSKPVACVKARLIQIIKYHHKNWPKKIKRIVAEVTRGYILPNSSQYWLEESLLIPPIVASYLKRCKLMNVKYKLYFRIAKAANQEATLKLPIIIGTIPLRDCVDIISQNSEPSDIDGFAERAVQIFEPCLFGPHQIQDDENTKGKTSKEEHTFSPFYITYIAS